MEDFEAAEPTTSTDQSRELYPSRKTPQRPVQDNRLEDEPPLSEFGYPLDSSVPVFLKIEFLPDAAEALGVDQAAAGTLEIPISDFLAGIPYTYTETYFEYHEVETVCLTREVGPFVVCERVYGENPDEDFSPKKVRKEPVVPFTNTEDNAIFAPELEVAMVD